MSHIVIVFIILVATVSASPRFDGRIVNGKPGNINDFPYQVSILYDNLHNCGGSIISEEYILTAAHCVKGFEVELLSIRAGSSYHDEGGQLINVVTYKYHPDFDSFTYECDVAVMKLETPLLFGPGVQPIELMNINSASPGDMTYISGWGDLKEGGNTPKQLQYVEVPMMSNSKCREYYEPDEITDNMICAGYVDGTADSCQGDSGGPLAYEGQLLGIVSWGNGCAQPGYPGVYASVPKLRTFIKFASGV